jgi:hypothetical protein
MTESWGDGIATAPAEVIFDLEQAAPDVFHALVDSREHVRPAVDRLREAIPVMGSASPGAEGNLYRLRGHNRSVCAQLGPDRGTSDVIVLKGSEPLLPDFASYLDWMQVRQFGMWPRPIMEHFPLAEGKAPGTVFLDEARKEAETSLDVQARHLRHYGGLLRMPVPLFVFRLSEAREAAVVAELQSRMSDMAFDRVEPHLARGIGIFAYYYPGPPIRVHAVGRPRFLWPGPDGIASRENVIDRMIPGWITMAARLLWLGLFPATPLSYRLGTIFEANNACLDGGVCDVGSIYPMDKSPNEGFFIRSVIMGVGSLRTVIARAFGIPMAELPQTSEQEVASFYLSAFVKRAVERALETESRSSLKLDPRVLDVFGGEKPLPELLTLFQTFNSYLGTSEYA